MAYNKELADQLTLLVDKRDVNFRPKKISGDWYGHAGGEPGVGAQVEFHLGKKVGLIIFSNKRNGSVYIGNKIHAMIRRIASNYR